MTVTVVDFPGTLKVGDSVRISNPARTESDNYVEPSFFGKVGEIVATGNSDGLEVRVADEGTNIIGAAYLTKVVEPTTTLKAGDRVNVAVGAESKDGYAATAMAGKVGKLDFLDGYSGWYVRPDGGTPGVGNYVAVRYLTPVTDAAAEEVAKLTADLAQAQRDLQSASAAAASFKDKVRSEAGSIAEDDTDLYEPMNQLLEELGLDSLARDYEVQVTFRGSYTVTVTATSEDNARDKISSDTIGQYVAESDDPAYIIDSYETEVE